MQGNTLLDSLPVDMFKRLAPHVEKVILPANKNIFNSGDLLDYVYFPLDAVFHLFLTMENGATIEAGMVGSEGVLGLSAFFGFDKFFSHATILSANKALRISAKTIKTEFDQDITLRQPILRYAHSFFVQTAQLAACNRVHHMEIRVCRWLLLLRDKTRSDMLTVTQEFIARMLGTQRPYVTTAIGLLQKQGILRCGRGVIEILDYQALKDCSCECYPIIQENDCRGNEFALLR